MDNEIYMLTEEEQRQIYGEPWPTDDDMLAMEEEYMRKRGMEQGK